MRKLLAVVGVAGLVACAGAAQAGDGYGSQPWTGFYVGAHAGYGWGELDGTLTYDPGTGPVPGVFDPADRSIDMDGALGGLQIGFNRQTGSLVWGIEADVSWTGMEGGDTFCTATGCSPAGVDWTIEPNLDVFGTVRGRLGFASNNLLVYGTGGLAVGRTSADLTVHQLFPANANLTATGSATENHVGWTIGGGAEWSVSPHWSLKAEYLYVDLGNADYRLTGTNHISGGAHTTDSFPADLTLHTVRLGLNYQFGD